MSLVFKRILVGVFVIGLGVLTAVSASRASVAAAPDEGADLFKAKCAGCHGANGAGSAMGQKLGTHNLGAAEVQKMTDAQLSAIIAKGKNKMPPYEKSLAADKIKLLLAHIRTFGHK